MFNFDQLSSVNNWHAVIPIESYKIGELIISKHLTNGVDFAYRIVENSLLTFFYSEFFSSKINAKQYSLALNSI